MASLVHSFFAWRIYVITGSEILTGVTIIFAAWGAGTCVKSKKSLSNLYQVGAIASTATALTGLSFEDFGRLPWAYIWLICSSLTDVLITSIFTRSLQKVIACYEYFAERC
jgi:cytochrome bd-type quinol oxidase subunit 1